METSSQVDSAPSILRITVIEQVTVCLQHVAAALSREEHRQHTPGNFGLYRLRGFNASGQDRPRLGSSSVKVVKCVVTGAACC